MIKNWLLYLPGLVGALVFHVFYFGWFSWFILVLVLSLPLFSLVVSILAMVRVRLHLSVPKRCSRGDPAYVTLRATGSFLPLPRCRFRLHRRWLYHQFRCLRQTHWKSKQTQIVIDPGFCQTAA